MLGLVCAVLMAAALAWVGYQLFLTDLVSQRSHRRELAGLRSQWQQGQDPATAPVQRGQVVAALRIPAFGAGYEVPILSGSNSEVLRRGVGHYSSTAGPGQLGNFALVGYRVTHGEPFARLRELSRGDQVMVETRRAIFTYVLDVAPRDLTVRSGDSWVLAPVPGETSAKPTRPLLTLVTSQDLLPTDDRSVGFAHLASTQNKG